MGYVTGRPLNSQPPARGTEETGIILVEGIALAQGAGSDLQGLRRAAPPLSAIVTNWPTPPEGFSATPQIPLEAQNDPD